MMAPPGGRGGLAGKRSRTGFPVSNLIPFSGYGLKGDALGCGPEGAAGDAENAERCSEQKTAEHSAGRATCADKAGFSGTCCADARRQTKGGQLGGSRPRERRLAGLPFRGSVLNLAQCGASARLRPRKPGAMRRNLRQAKRFAQSAPRCEACVARSARRKTRVVFPVCAVQGRRAAPKAELRAWENDVNSESETAHRALSNAAPKRDAIRSSADTPTRTLDPPDATAPDSEFPDAATRTEKRLTRLVPQGTLRRESIRRRTALRMAAPRLSSPRHKICAGRRSLAARPRPTALPLQTRSMGLPRRQLLPHLRGRGSSARRAKHLSAPIKAAPSPRAETSDRRGKKSAGDSLSLTKRWPEAESDEPCGKMPSAPRNSCAASALPPCLGPFFHRHAPTKRTERPPESSTSPFRAPSRGSRARTARQNVLRRR